MKVQSQQATYSASVCITKQQMEIEMEIFNMIKDNQNPSRFLNSENDPMWSEYIDFSDDSDAPRPSTPILNNHVHQQACVFLRFVVSVQGKHNQLSVNIFTYFHPKL